MSKNLSDGSGNMSAAPEILPPSHEVGSPIPPEQRAKRQMRKYISGALLFEMFLWLLSQFFTVRGVPSVILSRIFLVLMGVTGIALTWVTVRDKSSKQKIWPISGSVVVLALALYGLDRWIPLPSAPVSPASSTNNTGARPTPIPARNAESSPTPSLTFHTPIPEKTDKEKHDIVLKFFHQYIKKHPDKVTIMNGDEFVPRLEAVKWINDQLRAA